VVAHRRTQKPEIRFPFFHIQSDGFWKALDAAGRPTTDRRSAAFAELDPEFGAILKDSSFRDAARKILISCYFTPPERVSLCALLGLPVLTEGDVANSSASQFADEAELRGREARFRLRVVSLYNYTCALTGYRLMTVSASSIIDAAHILQFADSRNNEIRNGLALCKNAHWLFDNGLWTIEDDYTVRVALGHFAEDSSDQRRLSEYHGQMIRLPSDPALSPDPVHLRWHRKQRFRGPV
jgi:putative restriction endonuclease